MKNVHLGQQAPVFTIEGNPDNFADLITTHGVLSRIMRSRECPCTTKTGSPNMYCNICHGDGMIYDFQREMLKIDEKSDICNGKICTFFQPIMAVKRVERLLPDEQGGITEYDVVEFTDSEIIIAVKEGQSGCLPKSYENVRVSYIYDRYNYVDKEQVTVDAERKILTTDQTRFNGMHKHGNIWNIHGDIAEIKTIFDVEKNYYYQDFYFRKNCIFLGNGEPRPSNTIEVSYYYVAPAFVLPSDMNVRYEKGEKFTSQLPSGQCRIAFDASWELGDGDLITMLSTTYYKSEIRVHNTGYDRLFEFDVYNVNEKIFDEDGKVYFNNVDFILTGLRDIRWIGSQPAAGKKISIRYGFHPTYKIYIDEVMPNTLENKQFPIIVTAHIWGKATSKDFEQIQSRDEQRFIQT